MLHRQPAGQDEDVERHHDQVEDDRDGLDAEAVIDFADLEFERPVPGGRVREIDIEPADLTAWAEA